jgi:hypothetical protein
VNRLQPTLLLMVLLLIGSGDAIGASPDPAKGKGKVAISEIAFFPRKGDLKWVELMNFGDGEATIRDCSLSDGKEHSFSFPANVESVPPGGIVIVEISTDASDVKQDDLTFVKDNRITLHWTVEDKDKIFEGMNGMCGFYRSGQQDGSRVIDFVHWGNRIDKTSVMPTDISAIWKANWIVTVWKRDAGTRYHGPPPLLKGGSIARVSFSPKRRVGDWFICAPDDVTKGERNKWPAPVVMAPGSGTVLTSSDKPVFGWAGVGHKFRLQIAPNSEFKEPIVDELIEGSTWRSPSALAEGEYFLRARVEPQSSPGRWSKAVQFTVLKGKQD